MQEYRADPSSNMGHGPYSVKDPRSQAEVEKQKSLFSLAKVYLWAGLGLLLTGVVAGLFPDFLLWIASVSSVHTASVTSTVLVVLALLYLLPASIAMSLLASSSRKVDKATGITVVYLLDTVAYGILFGSLMFRVVLALEQTAVASQIGQILGITFGVSGALFLLMSLVGTFAKHLNAVASVLLFALFGASILSLVLFFFYNEPLFWITMSIFFAVVLLATALDVHNINRMMQHTAFQNRNSLAIFFAYCLYSDFLTIFYYVFYFVVFLFASNRK